MKLFYITFIVMLLSMISEAAHARKPKVVADVSEEYANKELPVNGTVWHCAYDGASGVDCVLGEARTESNASLTAPAPSVVDPRLPELVKNVWLNASQLAGKVISIPLHTVPFDWSLTGQLAESVMCSGSKTSCGVIFAKSKVLLSALVTQRIQYVASLNSMQVATAQ